MRDWLASRADVTPRERAVAEPAGEIDYGTLDDRVETLAGRLAASGLGVGHTLAVRLEAGVRFLELVHAAQRLGAILVPLGTRLTTGEVASRLDAVDPAVVVCSHETWRDVRDANAEVDDPPTLLSVDDVDSVRRLDDVDPEPFDLPEWEPDDPLAVLFTSGTTGEPKGVVLTFGNVLASATASAFRLELRRDDCWHVPLPMYHMGGLSPVYRSVCYGTAVSIQHPFDPAEVLDRMAAVDATCVSLVPTMLERLLDAAEARSDGSFSLSDLRFVLLGGAPCPDDLLERAHGRDVPVATTYGMTEAASQISTARPSETLADPGTVGSPLMFSSVSVLDENGKPCDPGEVGTIVVSGPTITPGYLDSEATREAFTSHGLRTGDVGYRDDDGRLWIEGRADDRILTGGETVDPTEVTEAIRSHPNVEDAAVVGLEDEEWGQRVAALVVANSTVSSETLMQHARSEVAGYKIPRVIGFAATIPRTASGTIDRDAVRAELETVREA